MSRRYYLRGGSTSTLDLQPMARILLVENDADVQGVVSEFLTTIEHQVTF